MLPVAWVTVVLKDQIVFIWVITV